MMHKSIIRHLLLPALMSLAVLTLPAVGKQLEPGSIDYTKIQSETATEILKKLHDRHYLKLQVDDQFSSRLLGSYIDRLDGNRSFFLQSDIDEFEPLRHKLDDHLQQGNLDSGYLIFNRYQQRLISRLEHIVENLPAIVEKMDFSIDESLELDRSNATWPKSLAETDELWRKRIKSRVIALRLTGKEQEDIVTLLRKRYLNQLNRVKQSNSEDVFQIYMNAIASLYDPHTNYLSPTTSENFNINMSLSLEGIGAVLQTEDEYTKVVRLVHAGPADKQGQLQPSDRIVAVAQDGEDFQDVVGLRLDEVVQLIRGEKGTKVRLEVIPVNAATSDENVIIEIIRDTVKLEEQSAKKKVIDILRNDELIKVGVIDIPAFYIDFEAWRNGDPNYRSTTRDVSKLLTELVEEGVEGIIIDLRDNGGGSLLEANQLTGLFIESGATVQIRNSNTQVLRDGKRRSGPYYDGPLAVMINRLSASASEIFAGAIQDYQRGIVIGTQSFGKGTVQSLTPLKQGQLKITESKFYRISGDSTQHRGVIPDISFPAVYDKEKVGESSLDNALPWDRISPIMHRRYFDIPEYVNELRTKHDQRMKSDPDFIYLAEQMELIEEASAIESITLNEKARIELQDREKEKALALENKRRLAKGLKPINENDEDTDETTEQASAENVHSSEDDDEDIIDPMLTEAGEILMDALPAYRQKKLAIIR